MNGKIISTIVGSYPKPAYIMNNISGRELLDSSGRLFNQIKEKMGEVSFRELENTAVDEAVQDLEETGIDVITDGEQRRDHYIYYILRCLAGFDFANLYQKSIIKTIGNKRQKAYKMLVPKVIAPITHCQPFLVEDFIYAQTKAKRAIKIGVPGPSTVVDAVQNDFYDDECQLAIDYAKAIREEVWLLKNAGCHIIQFDDPGLLRNIERAREWGIALLDMCFEGVEGITTIVHVCRSYPNKRLEKLGIRYKSDESYYPYLLDLLQRSKINQVSIEGKQGSLNPSVLQNLGEKSVILGCVDVGVEKIETVEEIVRQGKAALEYINVNQLILGPDCGLLQISREAAKAKLSNLARAAEYLNREL